MRADIAKAVHMDPADIRDDDHLPDLGLDSLRLMALVSAWEAKGLTADFAVFAEYATLGDWWRELSARTNG
ncbi:MAG: phosphopantetheine-binding protein [Paracoccus denitrificans]|nr:MAG: phosphopantetheine-binding protein [Paracoccus denitrificans]PZO83919.1 MAG: phosphopantetheine-binding protein [Paracoccus denitrificans]